jgi:queuine tRNA-ribosyltransferase
MSDEILSARLNTIHNLHFYFALMTKARAHIRAGSWEEFRDRTMSSVARSCPT